MTSTGILNSLPIISCVHKIPLHSPRRPCLPRCSDPHRLPCRQLLQLLAPPQLDGTPQLDRNFKEPFVGLREDTVLVSSQSFIFVILLHQIVTIGSRCQTPGGRDKFQSITDLPIAPLSISSWSTALADVDDNPFHVDEQYRSPNNQKYVFPEPGIFLGANVG